MININLECMEFEKTMRKKGCPDIHLRKDRKGGYLRKKYGISISRLSIKSINTTKHKGVNDE
jgi:hypothetical protein